MEKRRMEYNPKLAELGIREDDAILSAPVGTRAAVGGGHTLVEVTEGGIKVIVDPLGRTVDPEIRADNYHEPFIAPANTQEPRARFNTYGEVEQEGWLPDGRYVEEDGRIWRPGEATLSVQEATNALINAVITSYGLGNGE